VLDERVEVVGLHAPALRVVGEVHLHEAVDGCVVGPQRVDERRPVDRVDRRRVRAHLPRLLALQLPDEVPAHVDVGELGGLLLRLLVPVLADVVHAELDEFGDERRPAGTSSRRSWSLVRIAAGVPRGIRDAALRPRRAVRRGRSRTPPHDRPARASLEEVGDVEVVAVVVERGSETIWSAAAVGASPQLAVSTSSSMSISPITSAARRRATSASDDPPTRLRRPPPDAAGTKFVRLASTGCFAFGSPPSKPAAMTVTRTSSPRVSSMTAPKMMFASGCTASCTRRAASLISKMPRFEPPWIESSTPWAPSIDASSSGTRDRELGGLDRPVGAARGPDAHERRARALHDGLDVGEVEVDQAGGRDEVGDALDTGEEHLVGRGERLEHRDAAVADLEQAVVRHDDEGVDLLLQAGDALLGLRLARACPRSRTASSRHRW
jgi:hypothetical protein